MSQVNLQDKVIENERLELHPGTVWFLGPRLTLKNCTLVLRVPARDLVIPQARFIGCTLEMKKEMKNYRWYSDAFFKDCRFTGRYSGNDFGRWPTTPQEGGMEDCDFSEASLDASRFIGCDVSTLRFPRWPCFTILDPPRRSRELRAMAWPGDIGPIVIGGFAQDPPSTVAVTYSAPALAKRSGTTPEAIRATLEKLDGVLF